VIRELASEPAGRVPGSKYAGSAAAGSDRWVPAVRTPDADMFVHVRPVFASSVALTACPRRVRTPRTCMGRSRLAFILD
jgi:hypothetical protein